MQAESSPSSIKQRWELMREHLDERRRRAFAAAEAGTVARSVIVMS